MIACCWHRMDGRKVSNVLLFLEIWITRIATALWDVIERLCLLLDILRIDVCPYPLLLEQFGLVRSIRYDSTRSQKNALTSGAHVNPGFSSG